MGKVLAALVALAALAALGYYYLGHEYVQDQWKQYDSITPLEELSTETIVTE
ncbi:MAG: hypothetical protein ACOX6D_08135 [Thermoguttaceae bacterium]|jgi:hypothetical protein